MGQEQMVRGRILNKDVSFRRIMGFSLDRLWVLMLFYSIVPHLSSSDVRGSLYTMFFVSLCAMVVTMLFILIIAQRDDRISSSRLFVFGAAGLTTLGTVAAFFSDMSTPSGMLFLGIGAILTGVGSAVLFLGWIEAFTSLGERPALLELAISLAASFVMGFILIAISWVMAIGAIMILPFVSGYLLCWGRGGGSGKGNSVSQDGSGRGSKPDGVSDEKATQPLSRPAIILFARALCGAFLLGGLAGFFDVLSGYQTYAVQDVYGIYLFLGGFLAVLIVCLIVIFRKHGDVFAIYRFAVLLLCLGCLLAPFMCDNNTYSNAIIFGGYHCFILVLCVVCLNVSSGFRVSPARAAGIGFLALYAGEIVGYAVAYAYNAVLTSSTLIGVTLVAVSLLFIAHLFLFTEVDLVRMGIGDVDMVAAPDEGSGDGKALIATDDSCARIVERYGLSPRESDVLPLLLQGRTISRIQETLFISAGTVSTHIRHIYQKAGVNNRQELIDLVQAPPEEGN
jgi:DNA-binding CsgD family transcriptional regulator